MLSKQLALQEIDETLKLHGKRLTDFGLPEPDIDENSIFLSDPVYDCDIEKANGYEKYQKLNTEQYVVDTILNAVNNSTERKLFSLDGPGGTGKTLSENKLCLPVAFSGIAATLLDGGRTARSRFKIPINSDVDSTSHMSLGSPAAKLLKETHLIIWDGAPITKCHDIIVVDRLLQDIIKNKLPFGGKTLLFAGDCRQIIPVVVNGSRNDIIKASIKHFSMWPNFTQLQLAHNMRTHDDLEFAQWVLKVGDGSANEDSDDHLELPRRCIVDNSIVDHIFGVSLNTNYYKSYSMKAILTPKNDDCFQLNDQFPIRLAFAMTINKSQGQTFDKIGIFLPDPVFTHGQLYVAFSGVRRFDDVKIQIINTTEQGLKGDK
nr:unnamed protein product [Callosobruchus chinensis]